MPIHGPSKREEAVKERKDIKKEKSEKRLANKSGLKTTRAVKEKSQSQGQPRIRGAVVPPLASAECSSDLPEEILERIRRKAYELWEQRGGVHGYELEDWLKAKEIVLKATRTDKG
jgi:hypothetical protein